MKDTLEKIKSKHPEFDTQNFKILNALHSYVLDVKKGATPYIIKIPQNKDHYFKQEINILKYLEQRDIPHLTTPKLSAHCENGTYLTYPKIEGRIISPDDLTPEKTTALAKQLNYFLQNFHALQPPFKIQQDPSMHYINNIQQALEDEIYDQELTHMAKATLDYAQKIQTTATGTPIFNDLHFGNMLFDHDNNLTSIIDFGFCAIGNPHRDFHQLHKQHPILMKEVINQYNNNAGIIIDEKTVEIISLIDILSYYAALHNVRKDLEDKKQEVKDTILNLTPSFL